MHNSGEIVHIVACP